MKVERLHNLFWLADPGHIDKRWPEKVFLFASGDQEFANIG
jgi:hypothetical protein